MFNSVYDHNCDDTETIGGMSPGSQDSLATSPPPPPVSNTEKTLLKQNSYSGQLTARYARLVEMMSRFQSVAARAT